MNGPELQEALALGVAALVVGIALWRRIRRKRSAAACSNCDAPATKPKEATLRFHKRRS